MPLKFFYRFTSSAPCIKQTFEFMSLGYITSLTTVVTTFNGDYNGGILILKQRREAEPTDAEGKNRSLSSM